MNSIENKHILEKYGNDLLYFCKKRLGFKQDPSILFITDGENTKRLFGKTGFYEPDSRRIGVYINGRHPKDVLRSLAHEIVHHAQNERGDLFSQETLGPGYAQKNSHMRNMEKEAYTRGNIVFRDWEDNYKINLQGDKIMIAENSLRNAIKSILKKKIERETDKVLKEASARAAGGVEGYAMKEEPIEEELIDEQEDIATDDALDNLEESEEALGEKACDEMSEGGCPDSLEESKIVTPEQEESFHNRLFGTRLVALNAKLMSSWIRK